MCFHVDDVMISGPKNDPEFKRMMDKVKRLYEWDEWEQHEFEQCGCRIRQATDKSVTVDQESYARTISLISMSAHRLKHMSEILSAEEQCLFRLLMCHGPTRKISILSVDISVSEQRGHCWTEALLPVVLSLGTLASVPESHDHLVRLKHSPPRKHKKRLNSHDSCGWKLCKEVMTIQQSIRKSSRLICLIVDAKGVF